MTNKPIYVVSYRTESGDEGILGYWIKQPSEGQLTAIFKKEMPDEFGQDGDEEWRLVWWDVWELSKMKLPKPIKLIESI